MIGNTKIPFGLCSKNTFDRILGMDSLTKRTNLGLPGFPFRIPKNFPRTRMKSHIYRAGTTTIKILDLNDHV
jgi:hypothetical protein